MTITHHDGAWIDATLERLGLQAFGDVDAGAPVAIIGIRRRGSILAERLARIMRAKGRAFELGHVDITLYRDDIAARGGRKPIQPSDIPFDLAGRHIILVDDVLHTARTVRAALTELMDYGRPKCIRLLCLVDRGGRELPICADYVGAAVAVAEGRRVRVLLAETDGSDAVVEAPAKSGEGAA